MSTPPLVSLPSSSCFASIVMTMTRVIGATTSPFTLEDQFFKWPGAAWSVEVSMPPMKDRRIVGEWQAFGLNLEGSYGRFLMGDPLRKTPLGVATGTPLVDGGSQEGNTLLTKGWTNNINGILLPGDYIQLGINESSKLHMVTEVANSNGSGKAAIKIHPPLRSSPPDGSSIITQNTVGLFRMVDNNFSWSVSPGGFYRFSFRAQEVVNA